jgi:hypothetical protein
MNDIIETIAGLLRAQFSECEVVNMSEYITTATAVNSGNSLTIFVNAGNINFRRNGKIGIIREKTVKVSVIAGLAMLSGAEDLTVAVAEFLMNLRKPFIKSVVSNNFDAMENLEELQNGDAIVVSELVLTLDEQQH